jgi:hypothetical protein
MNTTTYSRILRFSSLLAGLVAALLLGSRFFQALGYVAFPFRLPGILLLGTDETQERYGYWGEIILLWLLSLPCIVIYASLIYRWWLGRGDQKSLSNEAA